MSYRQSTAAYLLAPAVLDADGAPYTGAMTYGEWVIHKPGGSIAALNVSATVTAATGGGYLIGFTTTDTNTLGANQVVANKAGYLSGPATFVVIAQQVYDSLVLGTDLLQADTQQWVGEIPLALSLGSVKADVQRHLGTTVPGLVGESDKYPAELHVAYMEGIYKLYDSTLDIRNVAGKVLGGGTGTITAKGVWAGNANGDEIATKAALESLQTAVNVIPTQPALASAWTPTRGAYLDKLNITGNVAGASAATSIQDLLEADVQVDTTTTPWSVVWKHKVTAAELMRKSLKDTGGNNITSSTVVVGQSIEVV